MMPETPEETRERMDRWRKKFPILMAGAARHAEEHGTLYQQFLEKAAEDE